MITSIILAGRFNLTLTTLVVLTHGDAMTFKTGNGNVVHQQRTRIAELEKQIDDMRNAAHKARFAREVGENIMLMLANTSFAKWPDMAKTAFKHAEDRQETSAYLYKQCLPK